MFERFFKRLNELRTTQNENEKLIIMNFATTAQTVLFFNQSQCDQTFLEWSDNESIPNSYQLRLNHCLSLLIDSASWALSSFALENEPDFPEKFKLKLNLTNFTIEESPIETDGLTRQFFTMCNSLHVHCPQNTRLRESLIRLIWAYLEAKALTNDARELANVDRITYLKHLTMTCH